MSERLLDVHDVPDVVALHIAAFPNHYLTALGESALHTYYESIVTSPSGLAVGLFANGELASFGVGSSNPTSLYKSLGTSGALIIVVQAIARRPSLVGHTMDNAIRIFFRRSHELDAPGRGYELTSFAVSPALSRQGYGRRTLDSFLRSIGDDADYVHLTTDDGTAALQFYEQFGFERLRVEVWPLTRRRLVRLVLPMEKVRRENPES